ncbi:MAG: trypsin-like peptidase domain-containing protein [Deltaproteobacteria bacterium]
MGKIKTGSDESTMQEPVEACPRNYKPWIYTLVVMAVITIIWALYEGSQQEGYMSYFINKGRAGLGKSKDVYQSADNRQTATPVAQQPGMPAIGPAGDVQSSYHGIIDMIRPAVVSVDAVVNNAAAQDPNNLNGPDANFNRIGSGVIIEPRGYVLSSYHVIAGADVLKATVYGSGGAMEYPLKLVKADMRTDMALLRIQGNGTFPYAVLGNSDAARTGDIVLTIGSPFGFDQSVSSGMISNKSRTMQINGTVYDNLIQTDSPINRGSSGGPMVNVQGEVIGINTAIFAPTGVFNGIGFAIPINQAAGLVGGVVDFGNQPSNVPVGQLAAWASQGRQVGNTYKLPNGQTITPPHGVRGNCVDCHPQILEGQAPNMQVAFGGGLGQGYFNGGPTPGMYPYYRGQGGGFGRGQGMGQGQGLGLGLGPNGAGQRLCYVEPAIGIAVVDVDDIICRQFNVKMVRPEGVLITNIAPGGPADSALLQRGDIVTRIGGKKVMDSASLADIVSTGNLGRRFEVVYIRNGARQTAKVKTGANPQLTVPRQAGQLR